MYRSVDSHDDDLPPTSMASACRGQWSHTNDTRRYTRHPRQLTSPSTGVVAPRCSADTTMRQIVVVLASEPLVSLRPGSQRP